MSSSSPPPSRIGRYQVESVLGRGAMGVIYKAHDPDIGRPVAIKLVRADLLDGEDREAYLERFRHEARAAGRCIHPNIVSIYDFALHEGNPFLAMEFIDGLPLGETLSRTKRFTPPQAVGIIAQVLDALGAAHAMGIVHRDVKPANILMQRDGRVKVTDFGISRLNTSELTQDGTVIGTPAYMSPEQCRGLALDARSDLFSTGTVLYELLSGQRPFPGRNTAEITFQLVTRDPADIRSLAPEVTDVLAHALRRSMAKEPDARFPTAEAMAAAFRQAIAAPAPSGFLQGEQTEIMAAALASPPSDAPMDEAALSTIERLLAKHVGPIARHLVRDAAKRNPTLEMVCEIVARNIADDAERGQFLAGVRSDTRTGASLTLARPATASAAGGMTQTPASLAPASLAPASLAGTAIAPAAIERIEKILTRYIGPISKVLIKRALPGSASEAALWEKLGAQIENTADRAAFLRERTGG